MSNIIRVLYQYLNFWDIRIVHCDDIVLTYYQGPRMRLQWVSSSVKRHVANCINFAI